MFKKFFGKKYFRTVGVICLSLFAIISIIFYLYKYTVERRILISESDIFWVIVYGSLFLIIAILLIYIIIKLKRIEFKFEKLFDFILTMENDNDKMHRSTHELIFEIKEEIRRVR